MGAEDLARLPALRGRGHVQRRLRPRRPRGGGAARTSGSATSPTTASRRSPTTRSPSFSGLLRGVVELDRAWAAGARGTRRRRVSFAARPRDPARGCRASAGRGARLLSEPRRSASRCGRRIRPCRPRRSPRQARRQPRLDELLESCEAFSLHLPLTPETKGADRRAGARADAAGKRRRLDTARAELVDLDALLGRARERAPRRRGPGRAPVRAADPESFLRRPSLVSW